MEVRVSDPTFGSWRKWIHDLSPALIPNWPSVAIKVGNQFPVDVEQWTLFVKNKRLEGFNISGVRKGWKVAKRSVAVNIVVQVDA